MQKDQNIYVMCGSAFFFSAKWLFGQFFYSLSIMMAIMFAYGSYLDESANIAEDVMIIALSDAAVSVLSGIVMFARLVHPINAQSPILVTLSGIVMLVRLVQFLNA